MQFFVSFGALAVLMEALPEIYLFSSAWTVPNPHQDSEVNSLWSMGECNQGKSAKSMRNFGRSIGSKGWMIDAPPGRGIKVSVVCDCDFGCGCGYWFLSKAVLVLLIHCEQPTWNCCRQGESNCSIET
jgi:hypothetical protein